MARDPARDPSLDPARALGRWRRVRGAAAAGLGMGLGLLMTAAAAASTREEQLQAGDYLLRTRILHAGTRSEGRIGRLYRQGVEVAGRVPGEQIRVETPGGTVRFTYMGEARPHLWSVSGWTERDLSPASAAGAAGSSAQTPR